MADLFDYVIVGAGSAGCVLANRLSEDPAIRVLLLEAGASDCHPYIQAPAGFIKTFQNPRFNWCYSTEPVEGADGRAIFFPRGKVLGGSSAINGSLYVRGQARDFNTWARTYRPTTSAPSAAAGGIARPPASCTRSATGRTCGS